MIVERTISISKPPAQVLELMADIRNDPKWHTDVLEATQTTEGALGVGTQFQVKLKPSMGVSGGTMTVAEYEPDKRVVFRGQIGKMAPIVTNSVESEGTGTRVTRRVEIDPPGLMRIMTPLMKRMISKSNDGFLANLKRLLEGS